MADFTFQWKKTNLCVLLARLCIYAVHMEDFKFGFNKNALVNNSFSKICSIPSGFFCQHPFSQFMTSS